MSLKKSIGNVNWPGIAPMNEQYPCILCGGPADCEGIYVPGDNGRTLGAPEGKARIVVYQACARCIALPGGAEMIEAAIHAQLGDAAYFARDRRAAQ